MEIRKNSAKLTIETHNVNRIEVKMSKVFFTLLVAAIGGIIGIKLKIPAGAFLGAMVAVAAYNIISGWGSVPVNLKLGAQIVLGAIIGLNFTMETLKSLKLMIVPALILIIGLTTFSIILAVIIHKVTGMDLMTALFSCSPGGLADMSILSEAYGAETPKVVVMHSMRLLTVVMLFPLIFTYIAKR